MTKQRFVLSPHADCHWKGDDYTISTQAIEVLFNNEGGKLFDRARYFLDGSCTVNEIASTVGVSLERLSKVLEPLETHELIFDVSLLVAPGSPEVFLREYYRLCDRWAAEIFSSPFWTSIWNGSASDDLLIIWGKEFYHRVLGANEHIALSVNFCKNETIKKWLESHYEEEAHHEIIFLEGLCIIGLKKEEVVESRPLPTTKALINYLNVLAATDLDAYLACYGVMHSPRIGQTIEVVDRQYDQFKSLYSRVAPLLDKIHQHARLDIALDHDQIIFERMVESFGLVDPQMPVRAVAAIRGIVTAFSAFFDGIMRSERELLWL